LALSRQELLTLARHGATARIAELEAEIASIRRAFPGVGARRGPGRPPTSPDGAAPLVRRRRRRRRMSKEARQRISEMMKKRWAERKKTRK
jgi:hypothetical protein